MAKEMATLLQINPYQVNVKATTTEQKGLVGKGEGIGAEAIVLPEDQLPGSEIPIDEQPAV